MKYCWLVLLLWMGFALPGEARGQAAVYGQFSVSDLTNLVQTDLLYGATTGVILQGPTLRHRIIFSADVQGRFVFKNGESLNGLTVGPRISVPIKYRLTPYGEFMVGFVRYYSSTIPVRTTDSTIQINAGVVRSLSSRWDASLDYSYAQYYALGGQYNPKTFSVGAIYHFKKR